MAAGYQAGRSLRTIADELGVHHRTVAARLEELGIPRRPTTRKMKADDVVEASLRYDAGDSLATVAAAFHVDAATIRRELGRARTAIRPRRGWAQELPVAQHPWCPGSLKRCEMVLVMWLLLG